MTKPINLLDPIERGDGQPPAYQTEFPEIDKLEEQAERVRLIIKITFTGLLFLGIVGVIAAAVTGWNLPPWVTIPLVVAALILAVSERPKFGGRR